MFGNEVSWVTHCTAWAGIWPLSSDQVLENERQGIKTNYRIRVRYQSGILSGMRVVWNSRYFLIQGIINKDERNESLDLLAEETKAQ